MYYKISENPYESKFIFKKNELDSDTGLMIYLKIDSSLNVLTTNNIGVLILA